MTTGLHIVPVRHRQAKQFVGAWHRHHRPPQGMVFALGVADDHAVLRGVVTVGRPVARHFDNGRTLKVTRTATDGTANANSMLYAAAWRATRELGYERLITYTQAGESGASMRGAGWHVIAERPARPGWNCPSRPHQPASVEHVPRTLWEVAS
ncbi:XF1762 family protein [Streptomyces griseoviridis]|uniref:XF1762 family protein n=1 Tax=Streptomyces griseoviridis TaxID=45398 RepID=UPI0033D90D81